MIHAITWMNLENMLSERSQTQKAIYCMILLVGNAQKKQVYSDRKQISGYLGLGVAVGNGEWL